MQRFLARLLQLETLIAGAFYTIAAAILFADVISREFFAQSIWGGQRAAVLLANASALIGLGVAVALNRNIRPALLDHLLPARFDRLIHRLGDLVAASVMFAGAYFALVLIADNRAMGFTTPPLDLQIWIPQLALPYGLASAGIRYLIFALAPDLRPTERGIA